MLNADDQLDALKTQVFRDLLTYMLKDPATVEPALDLILISRHLERIGDHATNIAEDVIFMVSAQDVRHHPPAARAGLIPRSGRSRTGVSRFCTETSVAPAGATNGRSPVVEWIGWARLACASCAARVPWTSGGGRSAASDAATRIWRDGPTAGIASPAIPSRRLPHDDSNDLDPD